MAAIAGAISLATSIGRGIKKHKERKKQKKEEAEELRAEQEERKNEKVDELRGIYKQRQTAKQHANYRQIHESGDGAGQGEVQEYAPPSKPITKPRGVPFRGR